MSELKRLEKLIKKNYTFLGKYETALAADPNDFGAKLMVGNIKWHIHDLENQASTLRSVKGQSSSLDKNSMAASAY